MDQVGEPADHLHPPKPQLTVRVGVVGHRPDKLVAATNGMIEQQLMKVFAAIDAAAKHLLLAGEGYYSNETPRVRLDDRFHEPGCIR